MNKNLSFGLNDQFARQRRDQLLHQISTDQRLPSLGVAISEVIKIASTGEESVHKLAKFILADVGLTKDILNLANSVSYRNSQGTPINTISKAIFMLGFDVVKTSALSMLMLECFNDKYKSVYYELTHSLCASIIAREFVNRSIYQDAEEASISSLFKNIGQVLIASQDPGLYHDIMQPVRDGTITLYESSAKHIGCGMSHFGGLVLQQWSMPDSIVQAIGVLPFGELKKAKHRSDWIKQVAAFSAEAADIVMSNTQFSNEKADEINFEDEKLTNGLMQRFGVALELDPKIVPDWLSRAAIETDQLVHKLGMRPLERKLPALLPSIRVERTPKVAAKAALPDDLLMTWDTVKVTQDRSTHASGKPHNSRDLLLAGVMEMTQTISTGKFQINDLVLQFLEILQGSLGFQFAAAILKDIKSERYVARISIGQDWYKKQKNFNFSSKDAVDLFHLALKNNADLMIGETSSQKIHQLRPEWHLTHFADVKSLMILPLILNDKAIGLIYADRNCEAPEGVPSEETALIKTMKGQLLAAMSK